MLCRSSYRGTAIVSPGKGGHNFTCLAAKTTTGTVGIGIWWEIYQRREGVRTCVAHLFCCKTFFSVVFIFSVGLFPFFTLAIFTLSFLSITPITQYLTGIGTIALASPATVADIKILLTPATGNFQ